MKDNKTLQQIIAYGLSVRQIPEVEYFLYTKQTNFKYLYFVGIIEQKAREMSEAEYSDLKDKRNYENTGFMHKDGALFRKLYKYKRTPENGGKWMAKQTPQTSKSVDWDISKDNLSDTLQEAVEKAVQKIASKTKVFHVKQ